MNSVWILRSLERLKDQSYVQDWTYAVIEGNSQQLWGAFQRCAARAAKIGHTLTAAPEHLCDPDAMTASERAVREASVKANTLDDFEYLKWQWTARRSRFTSDLWR